MSFPFLQSFLACLFLRMSYIDIMAANSSSLKDSEALELMEKMTRDADALQRDVLAQILAQNGQTEYLRGFGAVDRETFKSTVPISAYKDLEPFITRIADGDSSPVLCGHPISEFIYSTGTTTGELKFIPSINGDWDRNLLFLSFITPLLNLFVKGLDKGKGICFMFVRPEIETKGGIVARTLSTSLIKNDTVMNQLGYQHDFYTNPYEATCCVDTFQSMYTQMLCGLYEREQVLLMGAPFASGFLHAIRFLQLNWKQLTRDIKNGSLDPNVITDTSVRESMARVMRPDPDLAGFIGQECAKDNWGGIIARIWPNTKVLEVIVTGSMAQYIPTLDYYSGGLPIASMYYVSSEAFFGINLSPMCKPSEVSYTFMPFVAYFEFLPCRPDVELTDDHSQLVGLVDVEIGKEYELVITTFAGLYRYRVGDIVRVAGFHNSAPRFQFVRRKHMLLNIDWEKTTEIELQMAIENAAKLLNANLVDYTSFADTTTMPGHYVVYWELQAVKDRQGNSRGDDTYNDVLEQCCLVMEESLNPVFRMLRASKTIGPLEIRVVKNGTFGELMDDAVSRGASITQYKVPRGVSSKPIVDLLDSRVVSTHFSTKAPLSI